MPAYWNAELRATPVMMPGSAKGKINSKEMASRPKKRARWTPKAANDPKIRAVNVANVAAFKESTNAARTWGSWIATLNQCVVQLRMGHVSIFEPSKANSTMVMIGANRNTSTPTA